MANETQSGNVGTAPGEANMKPGDEAPAGTPGTGDNICPVCGGKGHLQGGLRCENCGGTGVVTTGIAGG